MHSNRNRKRPRSSWMSPEIRNRSQSSRPSCRQQVSNPRSQDQSKRFQGSPRICGCSTNAASVCQSSSTAMENPASSRHICTTKVPKPQSAPLTNTVASVKVVCTTSANIKHLMYPRYPVWHCVAVLKPFHDSIICKFAVRSLDQLISNKKLSQI